MASGGKTDVITFFTIVRPFRGEFDALQRQAIASWHAAVPGSEILLFGDRDGVEKAARGLGARHIPGITTNDQGTELVSAAFACAEREARHDWLCEVSADVILSAEIAWIVRVLMDYEHPLVVGQRWDVDPDGAPDSAVLHPPSAVDYFLYRRDTFGEIPPFAVGRRVYDNWIIWAALERWGMTVIDATADLTAIHVNHGYPDWENGQQGLLVSDERAENLRLAQATGCNRWPGVHQAPYILIDGKVSERHG